MIYIEMMSPNTVINIDKKKTSLNTMEHHGTSHGPFKINLIYLDANKMGAKVVKSELGTINGPNLRVQWMETEK